MTSDRLTQTLKCLNRERLSLLEPLVVLTPNELSRRPRPQRWSLIQVLQHMVQAEREVLQDLPDPAGLIARKQYPRHLIGFAVVLLVLKWDIPVPVPSSEMVPDGNTTLTRIREQWDRNFAWLENYVAGLGMHAARRAVFRHPVCGPLNIGQVLRLARLHMASHTRQINRIRRELEMQKT